MEPAFDLTRPVLYQHPRRPAGVSAFRLLLWPAWQYRVVAPIRRVQLLNILQKAVLGLCRAGCLQPGAISDRLQIVPELASVVLAELATMRYVDRARVITRQGIDALDEVETVATESKRAAHVFTDPWTGDIWPRIVLAPNYVSVEEDGGIRRVQLGTLGKPSLHTFHGELPAPHEVAAISTPEVEQIIWASRKQAEAVRAFDFDPGLDKLQRPQQPGIRAVWYIEEEPKAVLLATYVYVPNDLLDPAPWHACDPFGLGANVMLERQIQRRMASSPKLERFIHGLQNKATAKRAQGHAELLQDISKAAEIELENRMTVAVHSSPLRDVLYDMLLAWVAVVHYGQVDRSADVLNRAQKVLERLFGLLWNSFRPSGLRGLSERDRDYNAKLLNEMAKSVGFTTPLPRSLTSVKLGKVKYAVYNGAQSLRPRLIATLIAAIDHKDHPLRCAAIEYPNLLCDIDTLAGQRDSTSHDSGNTASVPIDEVNFAMELVFKTIDSLIALPSTEAHGAQS